MELKTVYNVYTENFEFRTKQGTPWSVGEIEEAYFCRTFHDPELLGTFLTVEEAREFIRCRDLIETRETKGYTSWLLCGTIAVLSMEEFIVDEEEMTEEFNQELWFEFFAEPMPAHGMYAEAEED